MSRLARLRFTSHGQFILSVLTSLLSFALDFGVLALLTEVARLHYLPSAAVSFTLGTTLSYVLSILYVFEIRRFSSRTLEYATFVLVGVIGLGLNELLLWLSTERLGIFYLVSKIVASSLVFFWNFGARKYFLFNGGNRTESA
jgi:putative flippase GtrA